MDLLFGPPCRKIAKRPCLAHQACTVTAVELLKEPANMILNVLVAHVQEPCDLSCEQITGD